MKHIDGKDKGRIMLYALSTCPWCHKTKDLLRNLGVAYDYEDVDLLDNETYETVSNKILTLVPNLSFPIIVIGNKVIQGFRETEIKKELGNE